VMCVQRNQRNGLVRLLRIEAAPIVPNSCTTEFVSG